MSGPPACRILLLWFAAAGILVAAGCSRERRDNAIGVGYIIADTAALRDRMGGTSASVGSVKAGDKVEILQRRRRWARVRPAAGAEGWIEERHIISSETYEQARRLVRESAVKPSQGAARARSDANLHLDPERKSPRFFQLKEGESCEVIEHRAVERPLPPGTAPGPLPSAQGRKARKAQPSGPPMEDWFLVRGPDKGGWALARFFDMAISDEVAQYAEGRAITAWKVLNEVEDGGQKKAQYLWATSEKVGSPYDFDGIRVFTWNIARDRYETAYRERNLKGVYPVTVGREDVGGVEVPTFSIITLDAAGNRSTRQYLMLGTSVRRK